MCQMSKKEPEPRNSLKPVALILGGSLIAGALVVNVARSGGIRLNRVENPVTPIVSNE